MKIIDFDRKGNVVRFYLGEKTEDWGWTNPAFKCVIGSGGYVTPEWLKPSDSYYGDDWDDIPYEHNAGTVYDRYIKGHKDITFEDDDLVLEPCNGAYNSKWSKNDMVARKVPCIIVVPKELLRRLNLEEWQVDSFNYACQFDGIIRYYFGDEI